MIKFEVFKPHDPKEKIIQIWVEQSEDGVFLKAVDANGGAENTLLVFRNDFGHGVSIIKSYHVNPMLGFPIDDVGRIIIK